MLQFTGLISVWMSKSFIYLGDIGKPSFRYIERYLVKIAYRNGENRTLYICCKTSFSQDHFLAEATCGVQLSKSMCPQYKILPRCKTRGQQVYCEVNGVHNRVTLEAYVAWFDGNTTVPLSDVATYVTNKSGMTHSCEILVHL
jgi:hypothetical protein